MIYKQVRALALSMALALAGASALAFSDPAQANSLTRDGFAFPQGSVKIIVFRPDVEVGSLGAGGVESPNSDWTQSARDNMQKAFETAGEARDAQLTFLGDPDGDNAQLLNDYRGLFKVVSTEVLNHGVFFDRLPTKKLAATAGEKSRYNMDWTLGPDAAKLKAVTGADYALFVYSHDAYGSAGRKAAQLFAAALLGAYIPAGVHIGYAGLVDLSTGNMVWFNADPALGGDPREVDGATKRVGQLMHDFPKRGAPPAVTPADKQ
jgi:hypothetical protein